MCGIIGTTSKRDKAQFKDHLEQISHRGPDHAGTYQNENISIGHTLLAIRGMIDDSQQPVHRQSEPWVLCFNGQIYNTAEIAARLGAPYTNDTTDTLLIYELIKKYSWDFHRHIAGMYAIALFHKTEKVIRLYRDSSGQKNLYYHHTNKNLSFCSELKGLLSFREIERKLDTEALQTATAIGYIPGYKTLVQNVRKLLPAECLTYDLNTGKASTEILSPGEVAFNTSLKPHEVFNELIDIHLQSKHQLSINLSGGMDSSIIFHEAVSLGKKVQSFSTLFDVQEDSYNRDAELARKLATDYNQDHQDILVTSRSYLDHFVDSYKKIEEPNFNISIPIYYQTAATEGAKGKGLRTVLSGDGGDEIFGGYPHYRKTLRFERLKRRFSSSFLNLYKHARDGIYVDYDDVYDRFLAFRGLSPVRHDKQLRRSTISYLKDTTSSLIVSYGVKDDDVYLSMLLDRFIWLASENFIRSDKLFMSQSMEMRCPFAYEPFRQYTDSTLTSDQYVSDAANKLFLRSLYKDRLPDYITQREDKTGWRAPVTVWYDQKYRELFLEILSEAEKSDIPLDWACVRKKVESSDGWPGKEVHLYLSIALITKELNLHS